jgi:hypothetical protein
MYSLKMTIIASLLLPGVLAAQTLASSGYETFAISKQQVKSMQSREFKACIKNGWAAQAGRWSVLLPK